MPFKWKWCVEEDVRHCQSLLTFKRCTLLSYWRCFIIIALMYYWTSKVTMFMNWNHFLNLKVVSVHEYEKNRLFSRSTLHKNYYILPKSFFTMVRFADNSSSSKYECVCVCMHFGACVCTHVCAPTCTHTHKHALVAVCACMCGLVCVGCKGASVCCRKRRRRSKRIHD